MSDKTTETPRSENPFHKLADAQLTQMNAFFDEVAKAQTAGLEQARTALDESARLSKETLGYWAALAGESRRLTAEAVKRSFSLFSAGQP